MSSTVKKEVISWIKTILLAVVLAGLVNTVFIVNAQVPSGSMETTIMTGDRIMALRTSYWFNEPQRGDVVVFRYPDDPEQKTLYVKRIIGMGGDTVKVANGCVYINGEVLDEPYLGVTTEGDFGPFEVPEGSYFMMGDNRNDSSDSRFWKHKFVAPDKILGKVKFRYYKGFKWIS